MKEIDKKLFIILLIIILGLTSFITMNYFKQKENIDILSAKGNDIVKNIKKNKNNIKIEEKLYEKENIKIKYPYIEETTQEINEQIKENLIKKTNNHNEATIEYEIKQSNEKIISIIFYGLIDEQNYSEVINIDLEEEKFIKPNDIFIDKNKLVSILKSIYTSEKLEQKGSTLKLDYLDSKTYTELINTDNIDIYFTIDKLGIIMCNTPKILGDYYINIEIDYKDLNNYYIEKETKNIEITDEKIANFLIDGLITKANRLEEKYPEGFVFTNEGNFIYTMGETTPTEEHQLMSYRGKWAIENNTIKLQVIEERIIEFISENNYKKTINNTDYMIEYSVDKLYNSYIVINDYEIILNKLNINKSYIENLKNIADLGYHVDDGIY